MKPSCGKGNALHEQTKSRYSDVPWNLVSGLRHRLVHDYEGINWSVIVEVVYKDIPQFVSRIQQICTEESARN